MAIEPAQLLVSELVTNAVVHGGHGVVIVRVSVDEPWLRIEVSDANAREYPRLKVPHDNGARGLHIVDAVASAWGCSPVGGRKTVWCEVPLVAGSRTTG